MDLIFERDDRVALVGLNRPKRLNTAELAQKIADPGSILQ